MRGRCYPYPQSPPCRGAKRLRRDETTSGDLASPYALRSTIPGQLEAPGAKLRNKAKLNGCSRRSARRRRTEPWATGRPPLVNARGARARAALGRRSALRWSLGAELGDGACAAGITHKGSSERGGSAPAPHPPSAEPWGAFRCFSSPVTTTVSESIARSTGGGLWGAGLVLCSLGEFLAGLPGRYESPPAPRQRSRQRRRRCGPRAGSPSPRRTVVTHGGLLPRTKRDISRTRARQL